MNKRKLLNFKIIGEGKPLVMLHSFLWDNKMWEPQIQELSKSYKCILIELWGHGDSTTLDEGVINYHLSSLTKDVIDVVDSLNIDKFYYLGLSVGGMVGGYLLKDYSERLEGAILMDTYIGIEPTQTKGLYFGMMDAILTAKRISNELADKIAPMFFSKQGTPERLKLLATFKEKLLNIQEENIPTVVALGRGIFGRDSIVDELSKNKVPVEIIVGRDDIPRPEFESVEMKEKISNSKLSIIEGAGHISTIENSDTTTSKILEALQGFDIYHSLLLEKKNIK